MSTTGVPGCRAFTARSRSRPERPGILMSDTTRSKASAAITFSACSAAAAWLTMQPFAENAETRNRSSDALSSTTRTRSVSGAAVTSAGEPIDGPLFRGGHLVQEVHPLTGQHAVVREGQALELLRKRRHDLLGGVGHHRLLG